MANKLTILFSIAGLVMLSGFDDPDFPPLPKIKSVKEWRGWADVKTHEKEKWPKSQRIYYPNGELQRILYLESNGDTTTLRIYKLRKDSTLRNDIWYNRFLKKWMDGDMYYYKKGEKLPYMSRDKNKYACYYTYDNLGKIIGKRHADGNGENFKEYEYTFDSTGLMIQQIEFDFFGGQREEVRAYVYEYDKNESGQVLKRETFFVPHHTEESVTKTDSYGNQKTTYYGFTAKEKTLMETIHYNNKGERIKKIEYDRQGNPQFISTYEYEYYK